MKVIHQDLRVLKFCNHGAREFFARHGLNWQSFMQEGLAFETVQAIDDEMARQALAQARRRLEA